MLVLPVVVFAVFAVFVSVVVRLMRFVGSIGFHVIAKRRDMQRVFVGRVGFRFGNRLRRADQFLHSVLVGVMLVVFVVMVMTRFCGALILFVQMVFVLFVLFDFRRRALVVRLLFFGLQVVFFLFFKYRTARFGIRIGLDALAHFILFGFDQAVGECRCFFIADFGFWAILGFRSSTVEVFLLLDIGYGSRFATRFLGFFFGDRFASLLATFGVSTGKEPAGQTAARAARSVGGSRLAGHAWLRLIRLRLRFEAFGFDYRRGSYRCGALAILGKRFARQHKRFLGYVGRSGSTRSF